MPRTFAGLRRHALNGPTMGTRWSALFHMPPGFDAAPVADAMQEAVTEVDAQMSSWKTNSDLMRLNDAPAGAWVALPEALLEVLAAGLEVGRASGGAFDIGMGDAVAAWGFGRAKADPLRIREALSRPRRPASRILEIDQAGRRARKHETLTVDLSGIAKGHAVDGMAEVARRSGLPGALVAIDGELRAVGLQPDGSPWQVAVELPDPGSRAPLSVLCLADAAVATSGDYRHWIEFGDRRFSHTMDPRRGAPLDRSPASVTVVAGTCMEADAWATALMVLGNEEGGRLARRLGLNALFIDREGAGFRKAAVGPLFGTVSEDFCGGQTPRLPLFGEHAV